MIAKPIVDQAVQKGLKLAYLVKLNTLKETRSDDIFIRICTETMEEMIQTDATGEELNKLFESIFYMIEKYDEMEMEVQQNRSKELCACY